MKNSLKFNSTLSTKLVHWNESQNCCLWKGVTCSEKGRVIGLNLFNESISGSLHNSSLFSLQYLENLNLACNKLSSSLIPSQFGNLTNLIYLNLSNAGFEGQIPIEISQLTRLVTLDLSTSSLLSVSMLKIENPDLAKLVWNFSELKELYLDGGLLIPPLSKLQSLSILLLIVIPLMLQFQNFFKFHKFDVLHLSFCGLNGTFPEKVFQILTLQTLDLSNNELLQGALPDSLVTFNVVRIDLSG
ncbi:receptor-like protein 6 [Quercus suber]|uniref:receptor-like protein 6 n=1 Tax=Quercus suber TaxID=58331 RepID=UPI0032DF9E07